MGQSGWVPSIDLPLEQLWEYRPQPSEPPDFAAFWEEVLAEARAAPLEVDVTPSGPRLAGVEVSRVIYRGLGGARISGWYVRPKEGGAHPGCVVYHGYSDRGARALQLYNLAAQGVAVLSMDCRGQGGDSPDLPPVDGGHHAGWLTRGLADPATYYYRYVYADAVLALEVLAAFPEVNADRLATTGISQGGGLSLAAAALSGRPVFVWADIPFLCDFKRAAELTPTLPYTELSTYLRRRPELGDKAFATLAYFDVVNLARRLRCPVTVTVGLFDDICPPSTIFGMFTQIPSTDKELIVMPYNGHEVLYDSEERRLTELLSRLGLS